MSSALAIGWIEAVAVAAVAAVTAVAVAAAPHLLKPRGHNVINWWLWWSGWWVWKARKQISMNVNEKYQSRMTGGALPLKERKNADLGKSIYSLPHF